MAGDTKQYEYENIDACAQAITKAVADIEEQVDRVASDTRNLFGEGWGGPPAVAYDGKSNEIRQMLMQKSATMTDVEKAIRGGGNHMHEIDRSGGKRMAG